ncbi:hypothetical protein CSUI_011405 [Cystoisospora suis]|uniref:Uncharacterized protein n=1 Tax=Cystoisospora suis TaxID=483139 RepID=A0A2C6KE65_9APIC|nr:hypothetical protein CSUI_011405 [Cystoisospora suis]
MDIAPRSRQRPRASFVDGPHLARRSVTRAAVAALRGDTQLSLAAGPQTVKRSVTFGGTKAWGRFCGPLVVRREVLSTAQEIPILTDWGISGLGTVDGAFHDSGDWMFFFSKAGFFRCTETHRPQRHSLSSARFKYS